MAKKKDKNEQQNIEPVTNCDQFQEVVENFHHFKENESILSVHDIEKLIVTLRGVQVIIDRDLAFLYQEEVKQMNRQVKRNIERFPADFMFQLTKEEYASLKCHFGTSNERGVIVVHYPMRLPNKVLVCSAGCFVVKLQLRPTSR